MPHEPHAAVKPSVVWIAVSVSLLLIGTLYAVTAVTSLGWHDSAELALRGSQLGATHAPGAPLHTLFVYLLTMVVDEPARAATLLSVGAATLTVGVVAWLLLELGAGSWLAVGGALAFGTTYMVWGNAVVAELYALSTLFVALMLTGALRWQRRDFAGFPLGLLGAYGLALAAHFANVIIFPACMLLLFWAGGWRARQGWVFLLALGVIIAAIAGANAALAARVPPFGPFVPDSLSGVLGYMSGAEHNPLRPAGLSYFAERTLEHVQILGRNYVGVGLVLALTGCFAWLGRQPRMAVFATLIALAYLGYFTWFGSGDYFVMVGPAYLVISLCLALGLQGLLRAVWTAAPPAADALLPVALICVAVYTQFDQRRADATSEAVERYIENTFAALPARSLVVARYSEFTALSYAQTLRARRPDLELILPARDRRHYPHGTVEDYLERVRAAVCVRPVVTNKLTAELSAEFESCPLEGASDWLVLTPAAQRDCAAPARH